MFSLITIALPKILVYVFWSIGQSLIELLRELKFIRWSIPDIDYQRNLPELMSPINCSKCCACHRVREKLILSGWPKVRVLLLGRCSGVFCFLLFAPFLLILPLQLKLKYTHESPLLYFPASWILGHYIIQRRCHYSWTGAIKMND